MDVVFYLMPLFFLTAMIYSSAGFGGGSTYLALLVLFGFPYASIPKIALLLNIVVVSGGLFHYIKSGNLKWKQAIPFIIPSILFSYLGGHISIGKTLFLILLGISLAFAGMRLLLTNRIPVKTEASTRFSRYMIGACSGGFIGFLSGLVGIGGGIFLAPLLYFLRWGNAREIAAQCSFFIFVNSLSGLAGQLTKNNENIQVDILLPLVLAVFLGSQVGAFLNIKKFSLPALQRVTAVLVLFVAGQIFWSVIAKYI